MVSKRICPAVYAAAFVLMVYAAPPFDGNPLVYGKVRCKVGRKVAISIL